MVGPHKNRETSVHTHTHTLFFSPHPAVSPAVLAVFCGEECAPGCSRRAEQYRTACHLERHASQQLMTFTSVHSDGCHHRWGRVTHFSFKVMISHRVFGSFGFHPDQLEPHSSLFFVLFFPTGVT